MNLNPIAWYRKRKRAINLGSSFTDVISRQPVYYWYDPESERVWMATCRYSLFSVESPNRFDHGNPERVRDRIKTVNDMNNND